MEHEGVRISLRNLRTFPWVREREEDGRLRLHGAYFAISDGSAFTRCLDEATAASFSSGLTALTGRRTLRRAP